MEVDQSIPDAIENNVLLDAALGLAASGTPVFPCRAVDKKPLTPHGFKDATTDQHQIREWWEQAPDALIGMPTGQRTGVAVFDVDGDRGGYLSTAVLQKMYGRIPDTKRVQTRGGGIHYYFKAGGIRNSNDVLGPGLDVRGEGGYVIVPPSPGYQNVNDAPLADFPAWLDPKKNVLRRGQFDPLHVMSGVKHGQRDTSMIRLAGWLRGENFERGTAEQIITLAAGNCTPEFDEAEALKKVERAYDEWEPNEKRPEPRAALAGVVSAKDLLHKRFKEPVCIVQDTIPEGVWGFWPVSRRSANRSRLWGTA